MKQKITLLIAAMALAVNVANGQTIDGTVVATENFNSATAAPAHPKMQEPVVLSSKADVNETGQGVEVTYYTNLFDDQQVHLASFPNTPAGDYIIRFSIRTTSVFSFYPTIATVNEVPDLMFSGDYRNFAEGAMLRYNAIAPNEYGSFIQNYTAQYTTTSTGTINFIAFFGAFLDFINDTIYIDNIELIKLNDRLTVNNVGDIVQAEENFDTATVAPNATGSTYFLDNLKLSEDAAVGGSGKGVEFSYLEQNSHDGVANRVTEQLDVVTFEDVPAGKYYIQYEIKPQSTAENFNYYNQITSGATTIDNYLSTNLATDFETHRTYDIDLDATDDISLTLKISGLLGGWASSAPTYLDNVKLIKVDGETLSKDTVINNYAVTVSPNPAKDIISIQGIEKNTSYGLYNITGQKVKSGIVSIGKNINIQNLASGVYFLQVEGKSTVKVFKQ